MSGLTPDPFDVAFGHSWNRRAAGRLKAEVKRADRMGMHANVFAKAGDSNLSAYNALYGLGCRTPIWDGHASLEPTWSRYRAVTLPAGCGPHPFVPAADERVPWNSFSRSSAAARSGILAKHVLVPSGEYEGLPQWGADPDCPADESLLDFEIRLLKPRYVFVMFGSNGSSYGLSSEQTARQVGELIDAIRKLGPVPVVFTIPPQLNHVQLPTNRWRFAEETSAAIARVARRKRAVLFDLWRPLAEKSLLNHGIIVIDGGYFDGLHLDTPGGFRAPDSLQESVDFRPPALVYGNNLRNLLVLRMLQTLDAALEHGDTEPGDQLPSPPQD